MSETVVIAHEAVKSAPTKRFVRNKDVPLQKEIVRERLIMARVMNGMTAVQAAERLGYKNSTQLSQIEAGERKLPNDWQFLLKMSQVYSVSVDFLLGISPHPERDAIASEQFAMMRSMEDMLKVQAATITTAFARYAAQGRPSMADFKAICEAVENVTETMQAFRLRNPKFDDMRGGASVIAAIEKADKAMSPIRGVLGRRKEVEQYMTALASGKKGPLAYLLDGQRGFEFEG